MDVKLIDRIAATIRRVDGNHTMGAGALAEAIVEDLDSDGALDRAIDALTDIARMARDFDTPRDPGRTRAFVGDVAQVARRGLGTF